jgi:hypothetical protein
MQSRMNDNDEVESIWKDALSIKLGHYPSSSMEDTEENKENRTSCVTVRISKTQLYRAEVAHTVQGEFAIISGFMLHTIVRGSLRMTTPDKFYTCDHMTYIGQGEIKCNIG